MPDHEDSFYQLIELSQGLVLLGTFWGSLCLDVCSGRGEGVRGGRSTESVQEASVLQLFHPGKQFSGLLGLGTCRQGYFKAHKI